MGEESGTAMTDMENYLETPGRDDQVKEVRRQIDAQGIEYIYYQFASVTARVMGKGVPICNDLTHHPGLIFSHATDIEKRRLNAFLFQGSENARGFAGNRTIIECQDHFLVPQSKGRFCANDVKLFLWIYL